VKQLPESDVQRTLLALMDDAGNDINIIRDHIEGWFNDAMERLSGWYKRRTQWVLLALAIGISIGLNVDTFRVYSGLYRDSTTRAAVVAAAQRIAQQPPATSDQTPLTQVGQVQEELQQLNIPMGWSDPKQRPDFSDPLAILAALIGWLITGFAAAQGAPFWFDTLNKLVNVRSTGQRPETTAKPEPQSAPQVVIQSAAPTTDRQKPGEPILKVSS
jgi:hypothetical protein